MPGVARHCNTAPREGQGKGKVRGGPEVLGVTMRAQNGGTHTHLRVPRVEGRDEARKRERGEGGGKRERETR